MCRSNYIHAMNVTGFILAALGVVITVSAINANTANNGTLNIGLLFSQFEYVVIGCFITLIGSVFISKVNGQEIHEDSTHDVKLEEKNENEHMVKCKNCFSYISSNCDICEHCKARQNK
ncbi:hypothetical protein ACX3SV_01145 [Hafnia paralvei]